MTNFCPNCFRAGFSMRCTQCGYTGHENGKSQMLLSPGMILNNRYTVGRVLGSGGFGVTYLVKDSSTGKRMAVKEYLPTAFAVRDGGSKQVYPSSSENAGIYEHGLNMFDQEARSLRLFLGNPSIVQVTDNFRQNGTSYYVMEFLVGVNLKALAGSMGGRLPEPMALEVLQRTGSALTDVHEQGLLHRDVSPENIFITEQGVIKLIDFGATRFFVGERSRSLSVVLKPGFSPPEQYSPKGDQGPWTDVYALGATILCVSSGTSLPDAPDRLAGATLDKIFTSAGLTPGLSSVLGKSLALDCRQRYQTVNELLTHITGLHPHAVPAGSDFPDKPVPVKAEAKGSPFIQLIDGDKWVIPADIYIKIGRAADRCNIVLKDKGVSRVHCAIRYESDKGAFILTDMSSSGTYLKAGRMKQNAPHTLMPGDRFVLPGGKIELEVGVD